MDRDRKGRNSKRCRAIDARGRGISRVERVSKSKHKYPSDRPQLAILFQHQQSILLIHSYPDLPQAHQTSIIAGFSSFKTIDLDIHNQHPHFQIHHPEPVSFTILMISCFRCNPLRGPRLTVGFVQVRSLSICVSTTSTLWSAPAGNGDTFASTVPRNTALVRLAA
jgi:hypothetical protein